MEVVKKRLSNIELLRILSMIGIVISHWSVHGLTLFNAVGENHFKDTIFISLHMLGKISVNIFVLISGYFLVKNKFEIKFKKIVRIILQVLTYIILWFIFELILASCGVISFSDVNYMALVFPIIDFNYWFLTMYIVLLLASPFINIVINNIDKKTHGVLLIVSFVMIYIFSIIGGGNWYNIFNLFFFLYMLGAFIKKYGINKRLKVRNSLLLFLLFLISAVVSIIIGGYFGDPFGMIEQGSFITLGISLFIFLIFIQLELQSNFINKLSKTMFGIYLLHDGHFRNLVWRIMGTSKLTINSNPIELLLNFCFSLIFIFIFGILFEMFRINVLEKYTDKLLNKLFKSEK